MKLHNLYERAVEPFDQRTKVREIFSNKDADGQWDEEWCNYYLLFKERKTEFLKRWALNFVLWYHLLYEKCIWLEGNPITFIVIKVTPIWRVHFIILSTNNYCLVVARNHLDCGNQVINKRGKFLTLWSLISGNPKQVNQWINNFIY